MKNSTEEKSKSKNTKDTTSSQFKESLLKFIALSDSFFYPLIVPPVQSIDEDVLFEVYSDLRKIGEQDELTVLLYSYGGDARTAFHIGRLLQSYTNKKLQIYPLREAKSVATLIASAADNIVMSELSELGPMDPQIRLPSIERRFSPLAIKHSLDLLHGEISNGHDLIVKTLAERLPDPLSLGEALKSLETGKDYLKKLLVARMFASDNERAAAVAERLVLGYPDHGYCIDFKEAQDIGLVVQKVSEKQKDAIYELMYGYKKIWDMFEFAMSSKDRNEGAISEAIRPLIDLKKVVHEVIDTQKSKKNTPRDKQERYETPV